MAVSSSPVLLSIQRRWIIGLSCFLLLAASFGCASERQDRDGTDVPETSPSPSEISFVEVTERAGLADFQHETGAFGEKWMPETMGGGGGFIDYNDDGWLDILLVGGSVWPQERAEDVQALRLYRNDGDGTFTEVTEKAGLEDVQAYGFGVTVADYDGDGDQDFFLTTLHQNMLFQNRGGFFRNVTERTGLGRYDEWSTAAVFFDADNDHHLDLYVGNFVEWTPEIDVDCSLEGTRKSYCSPENYEGLPPRLYLNNADGTFTEKTKDSGLVPSPGSTLGAVPADVNRDGWMDLAVANDLQRNLLYINNGNGTFRERGRESGMAYAEFGEPRAGMGIDIGVVDSTGEPTLFVGNFSGETIGVFRWQPTGFFEDRASISRIGMPSVLALTFGLFLFDVELDGDLDLLAVNGHIKEEVRRVQEGISYRQPPHLYVNQGSGTFREEGRAIEGVFADSMVARGAAYGDYDRDGDLDVIIIENGGPVHLWQNEHDGHHFLRVRLQSRGGPPHGLGARIQTFTGGRTQERRIHSGGSYLSHSEMVATFGLGTAASVDSLIVYWPSGRTDRFGPVAGNQQITVREGEGAFRVDW